MNINQLHSYHVFYFPFKWTPKGADNKIFSERVNLENIQPLKDTNWVNIPEPKTNEYQTELFNEKNFFYDFVHNVLYDSGENNIIRHFERNESYSNDLFYEIRVIANSQINLYRINLKSIVLNLYSTGTGILIFYLENFSYPDFNDILRINQFGRRVYPPFIDNKKGLTGTKEKELADYIAITGLKGSSERYYDDFSSYKTTAKTWKACKFIDSLIQDLSPNLVIKPVIDDRMHVVSWFGNNEMERKIKDNSLLNNNDDWYKFLFIDSNYCTCQNEKMKTDITNSHTYFRWQKEGSLYGISRYSMVLLSGNNDLTKEVLLRIFRTMYARMIELSLVQRASILKFSDEITFLSGLKEKPADLANKISDFYKEYIRFVNQIYFREITSQEQGIELYNLIQDKMKIEEQVEDLDKEIGELHQYAILIEDKERNNSLSILSIIGAIFIIPTFLAGIYGMNFKFIEEIHNPLSYIFILSGFIFTPFLVVSFILSDKRKQHYWYLVLAFVFFLVAIIIPYMLLLC
jgi:hypothetical protein